MTPAIQVELEYMVPKIVASVRIAQDGEQYPYIIDFEPSEEEVDRFERLIGDGNAKITVGMDAGEKNYGNGFGMFLSISLTCGQTEDEIDEACDTAVRTLGDYAPDVKEKVEEIYNKNF